MAKAKSLFHENGYGLKIFERPRNPGMNTIGFFVLINAAFGAGGGAIAHLYYEFAKDSGISESKNLPNLPESMRTWKARLARWILRAALGGIVAGVWALWNFPDEPPYGDPHFQRYLINLVALNILLGAVAPGIVELVLSQAFFKRISVYIIKRFNGEV